MDGGVNGNGRENANTSLDSAWGCSIDDHNHLEMDVGTTARLGGCMRQTEAWDMSKSALLALTLIFIMGGPILKRANFFKVRRYFSIILSSRKFIRYFELTYLILHMVAPFCGI